MHTPIEKMKAAVTRGATEQEKLTDPFLAGSPESEWDKELQEMGVGDFASVSWAFDQQVTVEIVENINTVTGAAIDAELDELDIHLCTHPYLYLEAVRIELFLNEEGRCDSAQIEIPERVLGEPYDLISEEATREDIEVLESEAHAGLAGGPFVRACLCEHLGELRLEVELPETPILIFTVWGCRRQALSLRIGHDERYPTQVKRQAIHVAVPNGILGDVRDKRQPRTTVARRRQAEPEPIAW